MIVGGRLHIHYPDHVASIEARGQHLDVHVRRLQPLIQLARRLGPSPSSRGEGRSSRLVTLRYKGLPLLRNVNTGKILEWLRSGGR